MIDRLEPRTLLTNVVGEIRDNVLYLTGTSEGDHLSLIGGADFDASINGRAGTTINGAVEDFSLLTTVDGVLIELGGGTGATRWPRWTRRCLTGPVPRAPGPPRGPRTTSARAGRGSTSRAR